MIYFSHKKKKICLCAVLIVWPMLGLYNLLGKDENVIYARSEIFEINKESNDSPPRDNRPPNKHIKMSTKPILPKTDKTATFWTTNDDDDWPPIEIIDAIKDSKNQIIITSVNCAYLDFADNFANSIVKLGISNFVFVPLDDTSHEVLSRAYPGHVLPLMPKIPLDMPSTAADFKSKGFKILTSVRPLFLKAFLRKGYTVLYNDVDMVWKRNVLHEFCDLQEDPNSKYHAAFARDGHICTCVIYMKPTNKNIRLLIDWYRVIQRLGEDGNDQGAFNLLMEGKTTRNEKLQKYYKNYPMRIGNYRTFPHGGMYFDGMNGYNSTVSKPALVHNNWVIGKALKMERFMYFEDGLLWDPSGKLGEYTCTTSNDDTKRRQLTCTDSR